MADISPPQDEYHPAREARCSINYLSTLSILSILLTLRERSRHFPDRELQVPRLPRNSCRERLPQPHVVSFRRNHISGRGVRGEVGNPGTLGVTARKAWRSDREWLRMLRAEKIEKSQTLRMTSLWGRLAGSSLHEGGICSSVLTAEASS